MSTKLTTTFIFMARKKVIFGDIKFYFDKKIRSWMVTLDNSSPQIIGDNSLYQFCLIKWVANKKKGNKNNNLN